MPSNPLFKQHYRYRNIRRRTCESGVATINKASCFYPGIGIKRFEVSVENMWLVVSGSRRVCRGYVAGVCGIIAQSSATRHSYPSPPSSPSAPTPASSYSRVLALRLDMRIALLHPLLLSLNHLCIKHQHAVISSGPNTVGREHSYLSTDPPPHTSHDESSSQSHAYARDHSDPPP